ncbi:MAG: SpoIIE family protein phosphatase [Solobacterium sp.]|nr:SpoIIE family protein phosphatase [Solobacterium sp.]
MADQIKKRKPLAVKSVTAMLVLGLFLFLGTLGAAGFQMYRMSIDSYTEYAYSYVELVADNVSGIIVEEIVKSDTDEIPNEISSIAWLLSSAIEYGKFRNVYLIVPQEDSVMYIIDYYWTDFETEEDLGEELYEQSMGIKESRPYREGEKEAFLELLQHPEWESDFIIGLHQNSKEKLATAISIVRGNDGIPVALVGLDIPVDRIYKELRHLILNLFIAVAFILTVGIAVFYRVVRSKLIEPVTSLETATKNLIRNLNSDEPFKLEIHTGDEIESLSQSFEEMDHSLKQYIQENVKITTEQERLRTELHLAARIQEAMLPSQFPPFPERNDFDIYAGMNPAKEVGGDFYDFFLTDDDHLALVIADVSGKGIPGALFMMLTENMIRNYTLAGQSPKEVLTSVNDSICANNTMEMFVTVWMGILDLNTGLLTAVNAGHEYPVLKKPDGPFELYKDKHGFVVGGMEDVRYSEYELQLEKGSMLFLYTDGLPEAANEQEELFGNDRMVEALNSGRTDTPEHVLTDIAMKVDEFVGEAPQFDDMTMMCFVYNGKQA